MRRTVASVLVAGLVLPAPAHAGSHVDAVARAIESDPVYVHLGATKRLTPAEQGRVRLAIVRSAPGRVKVAVVPRAVAARSGGIQAFAGALDRKRPVRGVLIVVAGTDYWAVTSYPHSDAAAGVLRATVSQREDDRLVTELAEAIPRLATIDPGPVGDPRPEDPFQIELDPQGFLDDIGDAFRVGALIVAAAVALPFIVLAVFLIARFRRGRAQEAEVQESGERSAHDELVALGDDIRSLDLDTSMPNANRAALAEYEQGIGFYDQANELLEGDPTPYRVQQARAAIEAGKRHVAAARERLG